MKRDMYDLRPRYIVQCTICGRNFTHRTWSNNLRPHKDKQGLPWPSTTGMVINTKKEILTPLPSSKTCGTIVTTYGMMR